MSETGKSFWHTAPGVITAVAPLITALGGVLAILVQNDMIGRSRAEVSRVEVPAPGEPADPGRTGPAGPPRNPSQGLVLIPWDRASATLVRRDGTGATVRAPTVGLSCTTAHLEVKNGQRIDMNLVRSIRFDAVYVENGSADGLVTLLDGREFTDPIHTWNCPVTGSNELGRVQIHLRDIGRIDFHR